jgi:hypothetical protein
MRKVPQVRELAAALVAWLVVAGVGCGDAATSAKPCTTAAECAPGTCTEGRCVAAADAGATTGSDAGSTGSPDGGVAEATALELTPPMAELLALDGARPTQAFAATVRFSDGTRAPVGARFAVEPAAIGEITPVTGVFTANGRIGGAGKVVAEATVRGRTVRAEAPILVRLARRSFPVGTATVGVAQRFDAPPVTDAARAATLVYPLAGAVMPENVYPPDVQWTTSAEGDVIRVTLEKPNARFVAYVAATAGYGNHWQPTPDEWRVVVNTDPDAPLTIGVARWEASTSQVIAEPSVTIRLARLALAGSIYYWDIAAGRIVRIDDGTNTREAFMPNPPLNCVGCHSVSNSGRFMAGRFGGGDNVGSVLDLSKDLTGNPPPLEFSLERNTRWWFSSWSPDDTRLAVTVDENSSDARRLRLIDPRTGDYVEPSTGAMPAGTHPAWSPDDSAIAYVGDLDAWGGANTRGGLYLLPVMGQDAFGAPRQLLAGDAITAAAPEGAAISYPTWTPDAAALVFAHGTSSRSENGRAALYAVKRDGTGLVRLTNASGGATASDTFQPRMSPFSGAGYHWVSYLSRRDYGNAEVGTRGTNRQQIWVSALKAAANPGEDPSEVGYWLPGQATASMNISAYWAPRACRGAGLSCGSGSECCSKDCRPDQSGALVCSPESQTQCQPFGGACVTTDDCCAADCVGGRCGSI